MDSLSNPAENQHRMNTQAEQTRGGNSQKLNGNNIGEMHHSSKIDSVKPIHSSLLPENNKQLQSNNVHPSNTSQHHNATTLKSKRPELCRAYKKVHSDGGSSEQVQVPCTHSLPKSCLRSKGNHSDLTNESVVFSANVNGYPHKNLHQSLSTSGNETQYLKIGTSQDYIISDESCSALNNPENKNSYRERACNPQESGTFKLTSGLHSVINSTSNRDQNVARPRYPFVSRDYVLFRNPTVNKKTESNECLKKPFRLNGYHRPHDHVPTEIHSHEQPANHSCIYSQLNSSENVSAHAGLQMPMKYNNSSVRSTEISVSSQISNASNKLDTCGSSDVILRDCNGRYFISASLELSSISSRGAANYPQSEKPVTNSYAKLLKTPNMSNSVQSRKKLVAQGSVCVNDSSIGAHTTSKCKRSVDNSYPNSSNQLGCKQQLRSFDNGSGDGEVLKQASENSAQMLTEQTNLEEKSNRTPLFYVRNGYPIINNTVKNGNPSPSLFKSPSSMPTSGQHKLHFVSQTNACLNGRHTFGAHTTSKCKRSVDNSYPNSSNQLGCKQQLRSFDNGSGDGEVLKQASENSAQMLTEQTNLEEKSNRTPLFYVRNGYPIINNTVKNGNPSPSLFKSPSSMPTSGQHKLHFVSQTNACLNGRHTFGAHTKSTCKRSVDNSYPDSSNQLGCKQQLPSFDNGSGDGEVLKQASEKSALMMTEQTNLEEKSNRTQPFYVRNGSPMMNNTVKNGNPSPSLFKSPSSMPTSGQHKLHFVSQTNACLNGRHTFGAYTKSTCRRSVDNSYPDSSNQLGLKQQLPSCDKESGDGEILKQAFENSAQMLTEQTNLEEKSNRTQPFYVRNGSPMMNNTVKNGNPLPLLFMSPSSMPTSGQYGFSHLVSQTNACLNGRYTFGAYTKSTCKRSVDNSYPDSSNQLGCKQQLPSCDKESGDGEILKQAFENSVQMLTEQTNLEEKSNITQPFYVRNGSPMMNNTVKNGNPSPSLFKSPSSMPTSGQHKLHFVSQTNACLNGRHTFGAHTKSTCKRSVDNSYPDSSNQLGCKQQLPSFDNGSGDGEVLKQASEKSALMMTEQTNLEEKSNRTQPFYVRNGSPMMNNTVKNGNPSPSLFKSPSSMPTSGQHKLHFVSQTNACLNGGYTFGAHTKSTCKRSVDNSYPDSSNQLGCKQQLPSFDNGSGDGEVLKQASEKSALMMTEQTNLEEKSNRTQPFYVRNGSPMMNNTVKNGNPSPSLFKSPSSMPTSGQHKLHFVSQTNACLNGRHTFGAHTKSTCKRSVDNSYPDSSNQLGCKQQLPSFDNGSGDGEVLKQASEKSALMMTEQTNLEEKSNRTQPFYVRNGSPMMNNTVKNGNPSPSLFKSPSSMPTSGQHKLHFVSQTNACLNGRHTFGAHTKATCERSVDNSYPDSSNQLGCKQQLPSCDKESGDGEILKQAFENSAQMLTEQTNLEEKSNRTQPFYVRNGSPIMNNTVKNGNPLPSLFKSPSSMPTSGQHKLHLVSETNACVNGGHTFGAYTKPTFKRSADNSYPASSNEFGCKQQLPSCDNGSGDGEVVKQASGKRMKLSHKKDSSVCKKIVENEKKVPEKQQPVLNSIFLHKTCGKNSDDSSSRKDKIVMKDHVKRRDKKPKRVTFQIDHDNTHEFAGKQEKPTSSSTVNESNVTMKSVNKKQSPEIPEEEQKGGSNTKQSKGENEIPKEERSKKSPKHTIYYEGDIPLKIPILKLHKLDQATVDAYTKGPQKKNADFQQQIACGSKRRKITPPKKRVQQCKNYNAASVLEGASSIKNKQSDICRSNAGAKERENENGRRMEDKVPEGSSIKKINTQHLRKMMYIVARNKNTDFDKFLSETIGLSIDKQKAHSESAKENINTSESKVSDATNKLLDVEGLDLNSDETTGGSSSIETSGPSKTVISSQKEVGENRNSKRIQKRCEVCWQNVENVADHIINAHAEVFL